MLRQIFSTLLQPSVARASYLGGYVLRPVPNCFVRYKRRPWARISPTKLFFVRERGQSDPKERAELKILDARYKTALKALRVYFQEELAAKAAILSDQSHLDDDQRHYASCLALNEQFNQKSAALREEREVREAREKEERELQLLMEIEEKQRKQQEYAAEQVRKVKMDAVDFITADKLDSAIEDALNDLRVHNFAIDLDGNRYVEQPDGSTIVKPNSQQYKLTDAIDAIYS